jgi:hypothetical protein
MKIKKIMLIALYIIGAIALILIIGKVNLAFQFKKEIQELFAQSKPASNKTFHYNQLNNLPEPVQRYFKQVLKDGQPYIASVRMKHSGKFKTGIDKGWINIKGEQYATTEKPGYIWKGTTAMFVARDMYLSDKGRLVVSLLSLYPIVDAQGEQYNQGELLRWLGESVLYPTNFLPSERLQWQPIDANSAKLTFTYKELSLFFKFTFDNLGLISEMETKRYMDEKKLETWVIKTNNYKEWHNVLIPTTFEVLWRLKKKDFSYAKFNITELDYNKAEKF